MVYKFWTDDEIDTFVSTKYPEMYKYFTQLARPVMKSDIFRLLVVHAYGGTWADVDTVSFRNMQSWTKDHDGVKMVIGIESDYPDTWYIQKHARSLQFTQWTFAAAPKHPLITKMLDSILLDLKSMPVVNGKIEVHDDISVLDFAGPGMFTDVVWEYYKEHGYGWWRQFRNLDRKGVKVMDVLMLPQIRWGTNQIDGDPESWVLHKFEGSWKFTWFGWLVN
jgi:alpha 1,6-mannosyltransferase